jgi:hypothetical protein
MSALKYWDGSAWQYVGGGSPPPTFRQLVYHYDQPATISVNATSYGAFVGPSIDFYVGPNGSALIHFYAQVGLSSGSDLIVTYSVTRSSDGVSLINASDDNCLYVAPDGPVGGTNPWEQGPGHVSGIMLATGLPYGVACRCHAHYRVSQGTTNVLRRRLAVVPHQLTI